MKILWNDMDRQPPKTYKTYANAVKAAEKAVPENSNIRIIIASTPEGRFFPVALGEEAMQLGLHFKMCVA